MRRPRHWPRLCAISLGVYSQQQSSSHGLQLGGLEGPTEAEPEAFFMPYNPVDSRPLEGIHLHALWAVRGWLVIWVFQYHRVNSKDLSDW